GTFKVYNIFLEGVSLLSDIRTQIGAILDKNGGDLDKLIVHLRTAK
ncbi:MAG: ABC transporter substrate-binding protein, partial [Proteobacteria bacterium]|nr:ABC transporter substrate-binding protein [Pseudomonadota bacterium]